MSSENEHARLDRAESAQAMIEALAGLFPATFVADENALHRPLAIGTDKALRERCPSLSTHARKRALSAYAARPNYLKALVEGAARLDLSGNVNGVVTAKDAAYAVRRLAALPAQPAPVMVPPSPPLSRRTAASNSFCFCLFPSMRNAPDNRVLRRAWTAWPSNGESASPR